jgi:hypothetical protein
MTFSALVIGAYANASGENPNFSIGVTTPVRLFVLLDDGYDLAGTIGDE